MASDRDIERILNAHSGLSNAETLKLYETVRDQILVAAYTEHGTVEIEIRQRRHRVSDPEKFLQFIEDQIKRYREIISTSTYGRSRNHARIHSR